MWRFSELFGNHPALRKFGLISTKPQGWNDAKCELVVLSGISHADFRVTRGMGEASQKSRDFHDFPGSFSMVTSQAWHQHLLNVKIAKVEKDG